MKHRIALLLKCMDAYIEPLEAAIFIPHVGEKRVCPKHGEQEVVKVDTPYWVEDENDEPITRVAGRYFNNSKSLDE